MGENLISKLAFIHIFISILAFSVLGLAALHASLLYIQNQMLRNKSTTRLVQWLPPLQTMEALLFKIIGSGFILLSASLASAFLLLDEQGITYHLQKIILSLLAWGLFATLLYGHHQSGLRGPKVIRWTFMGVILLMGAYFAGKLIHLAS